MGAGTTETKAHARAEIEKRRQWIAGKQAQLKNKSIFANNRELIKAAVEDSGSIKVCKIYDPEWTTRQFGSKLVDFLNGK